MGIKTWSSREDNRKMLESRNLILDSNEVENSLKSRNYYLFINGLESLFLKTSKRHTYRSSKDYKKHYFFKQFEYFYRFDRELSDVVFNALGDFEEKLKTAVAYNFCKNHCETLEKTMEYTNKNNYVDPGKRGRNYPFLGYQNKYLSSTFNATKDSLRFDLFRENYLYKLISKNDNISENFYTDVNYTPLHGSDVAKYFVYEKSENGSSCKKFNNNVAVPFWVSIQKMSLGTLNILCHYLKDDDLMDVMSDFGIKNVKQINQEVFLNCLDLLVELRNHCAHGELITRFRTPKKVHIHTQLVKKLSLFCYNTNQSVPSEISLYDSIKILSLFTDVSQVSKIFKSFKYKFNNLNNKLVGGGSHKRQHYRKNRKYSFELFNTLLYRLGKVGEDKYHSYKDWKLFKNKNTKFNIYFP